MIYTPESYSSDNPPDRIIGIEDEYSVSNELLRASLSKISASLGHMVQGEFLDNGARLYTDRKVVEYATPECRGPRQVAVADHAGMIIINKINESLGENAFPVLRITGSYVPSTAEYETTGYHENFLTPFGQNGEEAKLLQGIMSAFFATSELCNGAGFVGKRFYLSQKSNGIGDAVVVGYGDRSTHGKKSLASFFPARHPRAEDKVPYGWSLLEVRSGNSLMSRAGTMQSASTTSTMLRLLEYGLINQGNAADYTLHSPIGALATVDRHFGEGKLELESGKTTTALALQQSYLELMHKLVDSGVHLPDDELFCIYRLTMICDKLGQLSLRDDDLTPLVPYVGWAGKLHYLRHFLGDNCIQDKRIESVSFDRQWHRTDEKSIGLKVYRKHDPLHKKMEQEVNNLTINAPLTRATARSAAIRTGDCSGALWNSVIIRNRKIALPDPYASSLDYPRPLQLPSSDETPVAVY